MNRAMIFLGLLLLILSVNATDSIYAGETLDKKLPATELFEKGVIPDIPDLPGKYVTATVVDNTDYCLAYPGCYMILNITSDILLIPTDVDATFKSDTGEVIDTEFEYEYLATKTRALTCYESIFEEQEINGTLYNVSVGEDSSFCGLENYTEWVPGVPTLLAGESVLIKLKGHKLPSERIDAIPVLYGLSFDEWAWWDGSWSYKKQVNLTSGVDTTLTNFPAYFVLDTESLIGNGSMQADCDDLRVTNSAEDTEYSFEIEGQTCDTQETIVWVKIPTFYNSSTVNSVYAYYGNAVASEGNNTADVWSQDYERVFHFGEASYAGVALESSGNSKGTYTGTGTLAKVEGAIGQAVSVDSAIGNWVNTTNPNLFAGGETTTTIWAYDNSSLAPPVHGIVGTWTSYGTILGSLHFIQTLTYKLSYNGAVTNIVYGTETSLDDMWNHWANLQNSTTTSTMYLNGSVVVGGATGTAVNGNSQIYIGTNYALDNRAWRGFLDEYRLSSVRRTPDWIMAEYAQDYVVGAEETAAFQNTSLLGVDFNISDTSYATSSYVEIAFLEFNTTAASTDMISMISLNAERTTPGASTNEIWMLVQLDGVDKSEVKLRTVSAQDDVGSIGQYIAYDGMGTGEHNISIQFKRTGTGSISLTNFNFNLGQLINALDGVHNGSQVNISTVYSGGSYVRVANFTQPHDALSTDPDGYMAFAGAFNASGATDITCRFRNVDTGVVSPLAERSLSDSSDTGSVGLVWIDEDAFVDSNITFECSEDSAEDVTIDGSVVQFDLDDQSGNTVLGFNNTAGYNESSPLVLVADELTSIMNTTFTPEVGTAAFITYTSTVTSNSALKRTVLYEINVTNSTGSAICSTEQERYFGSNGDIGSVQIYYMCTGMTQDDAHNIEVFVTSPISADYSSDSIAGFEVSEFNLSASTIPPIPNDITAPATDNTTIYGQYLIEWLNFTDPSGDIQNYSIYLVNDSGYQFNLSEGILTLEYSLNTSAYPDEHHNITVEGFSDTGLSANATRELLIDNSHAITINNYTYSTPQYETVLYNYSVNFTIGAGGENVSVDMEYHGVNLTGDCTNVSVVYYCTVLNLEAYPIASNGTIEEAVWWVDYDSIAIGPVSETQYFNVTIYDAVWPLNITSEAEAIEQLSTTINATYGNASGIQGTVSGTALLGSSSGTFTCASGNCTASLTAPDIETPTVYQIEANLTLTSSYWTGEVSNKTVRIEGSITSTEPADSGSCNGGFWCSQGYDNNWGTNYRMNNLGQYINLTYNQTPLYQIVYLEYKDNVGYKNITLDWDCIGSEMLFKIENEGTDDFATYCMNQSDDTFIDLGTELGAFIDMYETRLWYFSQNNSFTMVVPYGLTDCSSGTSFLNYSCRDEDTQALMSCDYSQTFTIVSAAGTTYETFSGTASAWNICFYPANLDANVSSIEQYDATNYSVRDYFLFGVATGTTSYNQTIYMIDDTDGKLTYIYVKDAGLPVEGVYVYVQKHFVEDNAFNTVAMVKTDETDGKGNTYLVPNDVWYRFQVYDAEGEELLYQSETQHVACAASDAHCIVTLNIQESTIEVWDYIDGIASNCTWTNATKIIACSFNVLDGTQHTFTLHVYNITDGKVLLSNDSTTTSSGTLFYDLGGDGLEGRYTFYLIAESTPWILQDLTIDLTALISWGEDGLIIALIIIMVMTFLFARAGAGMTILGCYIGLVISWLFQFLKLGQEGLGIIVGLGVLVAVVMFYVLRE